MSLTVLLAGGLLAGFGASALNQWSERRFDARMLRTRDRPLASGRLRMSSGLAIGLTLSALGVGMIHVAFGWLAAGLTVATVAVYWMIYTPMKQVTPWCTEVGALSGALPALIGGAAGGAIELPVWNLFAIVFLWQMPHFYPISWRYRADYARGGFRMLSVVDPTGERAATRALWYAVILVPVALAPWIWSGAGVAYGSVAALLGVGYAGFAACFRFSVARDRAAIWLFRYSLIYLPVLLLVLLWDR